MFLGDRIMESPVLNGAKTNGDALYGLEHEADNDSNNIGDNNDQREREYFKLFKIMKFINGNFLFSLLYFIRIIYFFNVLFTF